MSDLIKRKDAITAINKSLDRETLLNRFVRKIAIDAIIQVPSADRPRCKDCKYASDNKVYGCMFNHFNDNDYHRMYADAFYCACGAKADRKTEPTCSKMEQVDKDIYVRSKDEPQIIACPINERAEYWFYEDEPQTCSVNGRPYDCGNCEYHKCTADEPKTSCKTCRYGEVDEGYVRCAYYSKSTEQDEPQTERSRR